jgi:hypothetical protein
MFAVSASVNIVVVQAIVAPAEGEHERLEDARLASEELPQLQTAPPGGAIRRRRGNEHWPTQG